MDGNAFSLRHATQCPKEKTPKEALKREAIIALHNIPREHADYILSTHRDISRHLSGQ